MPTGEQINVIPVYYFFVLLVLLVAGPFLLFLKKARSGLSQKFGVIPKEIVLDQDNLKNGIWVHSVSVGEFSAVRPLLEKLNEGYPDIPILVSTTTLTGQTLAKERVGRFARVFYFPFDLPFATGRWLDTLKPALVVIAETELWPGFLSECKKRGIKTVCVNGRMSPKSFKSYERYKLFFGRALRNYSRLGVQSENEAIRYRAVGGSQLPVTITGNMKLDGLGTESGAVVEFLRQEMNVAPGDFVIVAGSTHEGEERAVIESHKGLLRTYKESIASGKPQARPRLIVAPRHPERFEKVVDLVNASGFKAKRFSKKERFSDDSDDIYVLDGLGQLAKYYSLATIAFVGGTIKPVGGHNLLEPYAYSVPTCCGQHVHKTRDIANALTELGALIMVKDAEELAKRMHEFYLDREPARALGEKGRQWINQNQGAVDRTLTLLLDVLATTNGAREIKSIRTNKLPASENSYQRNVATHG
ncbi:MAG: 3-deoxy-D-manno-octulosonic acid transferase [Candidatus Melainabacteria bacterium]|nr:3-deoxy-D-manno-octulosonic acid transferase [Candidatus Melainabacteria bacterium]